MQLVGTMEQVVGDGALPLVLASATQNHVHVLRPSITLVVVVDDRRVAIQFGATPHGEHVAGIAVDIHVARIERDNVKHAVVRCWVVRLG